MLLEAKHDFMVIWGNIQKPKSQRHPRHNCWAKTGVGHHPVLVLSVLECVSSCV